VAKKLINRNILLSIGGHGMSVKLEKPEKNVVVLEIEVDKEVFKDALRKSYNKNKHRFNVPGFRKGKAPMEAIKRLYGEGVFYEDALDIVIPDAYEKAVKETNIEPVESPKINFDEIPEDGNFIFTARVTVKPEVHITQYKGVDAEKVVYKVEDKDIERELDRVVKRCARKVTVEGRPVQDQDTVDNDYEGFIDGVAFEGGKAEGYSLVIGSKTFIPGFEDQIIGKNAGDEFEVNVKFPEDYHNKDVAGKDAVFKVKLNSISTLEYPEVDDEFAKDVSEFDTLEEYKADIRKNLEKQAEARTKSEVENNVIEAVLKNTEIDVPEVMVENAVDNYVEDYERNIQQQYPGTGLNLEKILSFQGMTLADFRNHQKEHALREIKVNLMLEKIVELENITVGDDKVEEELKKYAEQYKIELEKLKENMRPENIEYIRNQLKMPAAVELLVNSANLTVVEKPFYEEHHHDHDHDHCDDDTCDCGHDHDEEHEEGKE
jgi:trigger factor